MPRSCCRSTRSTRTGLPGWLATSSSRSASKRWPSGKRTSLLPRIRSERLEDAPREGQVPRVAQGCEGWMGPGLGGVNLPLNDLDRANLDKGPGAHRGDRSVYLLDVRRVRREVATRSEGPRRSPHHRPRVNDVDDESIGAGLRSACPRFGHFECDSILAPRRRNVATGDVLEFGPKVVRHDPTRGPDGLRKAEGQRPRATADLDHEVAGLQVAVPDHRRRVFRSHNLGPTLNRCRKVSNRRRQNEERSAAGGPSPPNRGPQRVRANHADPWDSNRILIQHDEVFPAGGLEQHDAFRLHGAHKSRPAERFCVPPEKG